MVQNIHIQGKDAKKKVHSLIQLCQFRSLLQRRNSHTRNRKHEQSFAVSSQTVFKRVLYSESNCVGSDCATRETVPHSDSQTNTAKHKQKDTHIYTHTQANKE